MFATGKSGLRPHSAEENKNSAVVIASCAGEPRSSEKKEAQEAYWGRKKEEGGRLNVVFFKKEKRRHLQRPGHGFRKEKRKEACGSHEKGEKSRPELFCEGEKEAGRQPVMGGSTHTHH